MEMPGRSPKLLAAFREATMELDSVYSLFPKACGLSQAEYWSLLLVYEGVETQSEICDLLFLSRQTLNSAFKQLKKKGLVRLEPYEENQRAKRAFLTERGKEFVSSYVVRMHFVEEQAWSRMTGEEQKQLTDLTKKYSRLLRQEFRTRTQTNVNSCSSEDL